MTHLPPNLAEEALSETVPTAIAPADLAAADFAVEWSGKSLTGVEFRLGEKSLEWVRVADVLVVPRARLLVSIPEGASGTISNAGFSQGFAHGRAELPIALISGPQNPVELRLKTPAGETAGTLVVRFKPRVRSSEPRIWTDASCSRFGVRGESPNFREDSWIYVGCRLVYAEGDEHRTASMEAFVYWDGVGQRIRIEDIETPSTSVSVWPLRLRSAPGTVRLASTGGDVVLHYHSPERLHFGAFSLGIGPYSFTYQGAGENVSSYTVMPTVYSSFFLTESLRLVAFGAMTPNTQLYTDLGAYVYSESFRAIDRRVGLNFLVGAHAIGWRSNGSYFLRIGVPQGAEIVVTDPFQKAWNVSAGGFLYPLIDGTAYYNFWLRYGSSRRFFEFNYISWRESTETDAFYSRSVGLTVGFPLPFLGFF